MAKTLVEQIEAIARDEERIREAETRRTENISKVVSPIAEKISTVVRSRLEETIRANLEMAPKVDLSRDGLKVKVDAFINSLVAQEKPKAAEKAQKAKVSPAEPAKSPAAQPEVSLEA